jgi:hypothetical protein
MNIFNIFKKQVKPDLSNEIIKQVTPAENLFHCHYCSNGFEVTSKMQYSTMANKIGGGQYQAIGVQCPKCLQTCIYG